MNMYQEEILDHYWHPRNRGSLDNPSFCGGAFNPLCGDEITITGRIEQNVLTDIQFSGSGCAISQASASLLTEHIKSKAVSDAANITPNDIYALLRVSINPARAKCALLPLDALKKGLHDIETSAAQIAAASTVSIGARESLHTQESIKSALKQVKDPELHCDIVSLGLVYEVRIKPENSVEIDVTLTSMGCPAGPYILSEIERAISELPNAPQSTVNLVWEPAWNKNMIDPRLLAELI